jgi:hypothetical protein
MGVTADNLIMGPADCWIADFGTTEPADTAVGTPPGAGWVDMGGTNGGVMFNVDQTYVEIVVDQITERVGSRRTVRQPRFTTALAEATLDNLARLLNQTLPTPGAGFTAFEPVNDSSATQPLYRALIVDGWAPAIAGVSGFRRRFIARKVLNISSISAPYSKDGQTLFNAEWIAHYVSNSIKSFKVVDDTA